MAFVRERIPEEYWGMLKKLNLFSEQMKKKVWVADKEREIFYWNTGIGNREAPRSIFGILIWKYSITYIRQEMINESIRPVWDDNSGNLLHKGIYVEDISSIKIPNSLVGQEYDLINVILEVFQESSPEFDIAFRYIARPETVK